MSSNVGLSTPRGSGTSGYVQRNLSVLKPRAVGVGAPYSLNDANRPPKTRKPDQAILNHDRMRDIEIKVLELRDKLEEEGAIDDDTIDEECDKMRTGLIQDLESGRNKGGKAPKTKSYQVHELAEAKAKESEKLRRALGLKDYAAGDGQGHSEHPMARQEKRKREAETSRLKTESEKQIQDYQ